MNVLGIIPAGRRLKILRRPPESILPSTPRPARRDCHGRLLSALGALAGDDARIAESGLRPWHSATFIGSRHNVTMVFAGNRSEASARRFADALADAEFSLPGHIVIEVKPGEPAPAAHDGVRLAVEILTVEAW